MIVDSIISLDIVSFYDGFSIYNQILINLTNQHKNAFTTSWGNFCWKVMSFGLKNLGARYQRDMVAMFHEHIHKLVEVYVDDILIKLKQGQYHLDILEEVFYIIKKI